MSAAAAACGRQNIQIEYLHVAGRVKPHTQHTHIQHTRTVEWFSALVFVGVDGVVVVVARDHFRVHTTDSSRKTDLARIAVWCGRSERHCKQP